MFKIIPIVAISLSIQPKHRLVFTSFPTSELCGTDEESKSTSFNSKGRSREFIQFVYCFSKVFMHPFRSSLGSFFGKNCEALMRAKEGNKKQPNKVPAVAWHEGRKGCAEKALERKFIFSKTQLHSHDCHF